MMTMQMIVNPMMCLPMMCMVAVIRMRFRVKMWLRMVVVVMMMVELSLFHFLWRSTFGKTRHDRVWGHVADVGHVTWQILCPGSAYS